MSSISVPVTGVVSAAVARETARSVVNVPIGYLRAFVTGLVVLHHALLAYHPFAPAPSASLLTEPRWWPAFPVVDMQRSMGTTLIVGFNETFFMSLMFLLSGLFVWHSIQRKGALAFVRARALRLGVPFAIASLLLAPLAYYPAYLQTTARAISPGFWDQWTSLGVWFSGPVWFVWVLLAVTVSRPRCSPMRGERSRRGETSGDVRRAIASGSSPRSPLARSPSICPWP
jgi:Acyltransferase family